MTYTAYYVVDDDRPGFVTYDADRAEWYSRHGHRVTAVTGDDLRTADINV